MPVLKSALSLAAVLALLAAAPAPVLAKTHCKTHVVKVVVKKVICDCKARPHKVIYKKSTHRTVTRTTWHEPAYPGRPAGVVYVDESASPVYGGNHSLYVGESSTYSRTVRITRRFGGDCACGHGDLTGRIDDSMFDGGVGYGGGDYGYGGGYYDAGAYRGGYGPAMFRTFGGLRSSSRQGYSHAEAHVETHVHGGGNMHMGGHGHGGYMGGHGGGMHGGHMGGHMGGHPGGGHGW